jgi:hypothetical protein
MAESINYKGLTIANTPTGLAGIRLNDNFSTLIDNAPKCNYSAITDPGITNDLSEGYYAGSRWINTSSNEEFTCLDNINGAAVWKSTTTTGTGDVVGPASATDNATVVFDGTTGKLIKDSGSGNTIGVGHAILNGVNSTITYIDDPNNHPSAIIAGGGTVVYGTSIVAMGSSARANISGEVVYGAASNIGEVRLLTATIVTTDATPALLEFGYDSNTYASMPNNSTWCFTADITARTQSGGLTYREIITGQLFRGANAASTTIKGSNATETYILDFAGSSNITADTTNGGIAITVIGVVATNAHWFAKIDISESIYL